MPEQTPTVGVAKSERIDTFEKWQEYVKEVSPYKDGVLNWHCEDDKWFTLFGGEPTAENYWMWRELIRAMKRPRDWKPIFGDEKWLNPLHFVYVSTSNPDLIAYTQDAEKGKRDIQTPIKVGAYLKKYYGDKLSDADIREWANKHRLKWQEQQVQWAVTEDEIAEVYQNGPNSCMSHPPAQFNLPDDKHPSMAYATDGELKLAYLKRDGRITARALCVEAKKTYVRLYGDQNLADKLTEMGYKHHQSLRGARIKAILTRNRDDSPVFLLPYIDGDCQSVRLSEDKKWLDVTPEGDAGVSQGGWAHAHALDPALKYYTCRHCGHSQQDRSFFHGSYGSTADSRLVCQHCVDRGSYVWAVTSTSGGMSYVLHPDAIAGPDGRNYWNGVDLSRFGFARLYTGGWGIKAECVPLVTGHWAPKGDDEVVPCGERDGETVYIRTGHVTYEMFIDSEFKHLIHHTCVPAGYQLSDFKPLIEVLQEVRNTMPHTLKKVAQLADVGQFEPFTALPVRVQRALATQLTYFTKQTAKKSA